MFKKIAVLKGDGIGPEVTNQSLRERAEQLIQFADAQQL